MNRITKLFSGTAGAALALAIFSASPASAVVATFSGTGTAGGTDPLGNTWATGNNFVGYPTWAMPGVGTGWADFNPLGVSNGNGDYATQLTITFTGGVPLNRDGSVDFTDGPDGTGFGVGFSEDNGIGAWDTTYVGLNEIVFTAPDGVRLNAGDPFDVFIEFPINKSIDPSTFAFTATWSDGSAATNPAPEPASLALLGSGLFGIAMRRKLKAK